MSGVASAPDGVRIHFDAVGAGRPALVLVHGWSCDRGYWSNQLAFFAERHRVLAPDLAGHGESGTRGSYTVPAFGADVAAVMEADAIDDAVLVGHSLGGDVIVDTALLAPASVRAIVWVDAYGSLGDPRTPDEREAIVARFRDDFATVTEALVRGMFPPDADPAIVDRVARDMASAPPDIALDAIAHSIANDDPVREGLRRLACPKVAINPGYRPTDEASLAAYGIRTVIHQGVGHFGMLEDPDGFNRLLSEAVATFV